jgi:Tol biopolymer transport system component
VGSEDSGSAFGTGQIFVIPAEGGEPKRIQPQFPFARYPIWAPDSKRLLFAGTRNDGVKDWWVSAIEGGEAVRTNAFPALGHSMPAVGFPEQWSGGKVLFSASEGQGPHLWQLAISPANWQASGPPRRLTDGDGIEQHSAAGAAGRVLFASLKTRLDLWSLPLDPNQAKHLGKLEQLTQSDGKSQLPYLARAAPSLIYLSDRSGVNDVWLRDLDTNREQAITSFRSIGYLRRSRPSSG